MFLDAIISDDFSLDEQSETLTISIVEMGVAWIDERCMFLTYFANFNLVAPIQYLHISDCQFCIATIQTTHHAFVLPPRK